MRLSYISGDVVLYDMSTNCTYLKARAEELNARPAYMHPYEGHEFKYIYSYKNIKELK